jgi:hypothetical protein
MRYPTTTTSSSAAFWTAESTSTGMVHHCAVRFAAATCVLIPMARATR